MSQKCTDSEMGLKLTSCYKPTHDPLRTSVLRVYLITELTELSLMLSKKT